jgi:TolB-like protein
MAADRMSRRLAALLAADIAGYSRLTGADEEGTVARLRAELIDPAIASHAGRIVKTAGDGMLIEFASVVDAVRAAVTVQTAMTARNAPLGADKRIEFRVGIHLGDVLVQPDGDLLGDGVNIAARLEGIAEPGGICLSRAAHEQVEGKVEAAFADLGEQELKNIARPVRVFALSPSSPQSLSPSPPSGGEGDLSPPRLSIVVLPFANIGGDPEQEYFVDGVTESLTTDLSRISGSFVIARNTAFTYKGKPVDVKQIGRELNVRYALEGSVQKGGNRLRVNVQLIDAETGNHLWAERFDKPVADQFEMQDEIVARLAGALNAQLIAAEARRAERAPHPDSMAIYFQGQACVNKGWSPEFMTQAHGFFESALALDADNVDALVGLAYVEASMAVFFGDDRGVRLAAAETRVTRALTLAPDHARAHLVLGIVLLWTNRAAQGMAECERSLVLDRNLAHAYGNMAAGTVYLGRGEEAEALVNQALRLSPRDVNAYTWCTAAGYAKISIGRDEEAVAWLRRSIEINRNFPASHFFLAAALGHLGRIQEARSALDAGLALDPAFTIRRLRESAASDLPVYREQRARIVDGLQLVGAPEG